MVRLLIRTSPAIVGLALARFVAPLAHDLLDGFVEFAIATIGLSWVGFVALDFLETALIALGRTRR